MKQLKKTLLALTVIGLQACRPAVAAAVAVAAPRR